MESNNESIALVPDRFALYRFPVFKAISDNLVSGANLVVYADSREDVSRIRLVDEKHCKQGFLSENLRWKKIRSLYIRHVCFWQTGLIRLALFERYRVVVYWGEAQRLSTWVSAFFARCAGKKVVFWTHGIYGNERFFKRAIRALFYRLADALLLYSEHGRQQLVMAGLPAKKLFVINNSLDVSAQMKLIDNFNPAELQAIRRKVCRDDERLLVFVGRLEKAKRLDLLLESLVLLKGRGVPAKAILIGDGSCYAALVSMAKELAVADNVVFIGECYDNAKVLPLLAISDICVSPGEVGLTAMHSLICGTPVVTHNDFSNQMPEFEAVKVGRSGAFFRRGDVSDLADKICECLEAIDSGKITADGCREIVRNYYTPEFQRAVFYKAVRPLL